MSLLELDDVRKHFGSVEALRGVTFSVERGEVVGLVGDNGAGKSTLMKTITGVYQPDGGAIRFDGVALAGKHPGEIRALGIEMIYQDLALARTQDVASNIFLGREPTRRVLGSPVRIIDRARIEREAEVMLKKLGARVPSVQCIVGQLSGGQQQSVAIARALTFNPKLVIMDEPIAALAVREVEHVLDLIRRLKSEKIAIILISHRLTDVFAVCDRIIALRQGTVVADEPIGKTSMRAAFTIVAPVDYLDLATVIRVSQAISGEIVLEKLIVTLMRTAIEHAGAVRGVLILPQGGNYWIEAEARIRDHEVTVDLRHASVTAEDLPESVFRYVLRTKESILLKDASQSDFSSDDYVSRHKARSILCLPLFKQTGLLGMLYLENNLAGNAFSSSQVSILKLLVSEAATSLEHTRLYSDLQEREARIRRLVDSNIIGVFFWTIDGRIFDSNEAFLQMIGYNRDDLNGSRLRWTDITPERWRGVDELRIAEIKATRVAQPYEKEFLRKDGSSVPVLIGGATFDEAGEEGVAFVVDLTDRRRAEEAARESELRYHEMQMELAHANRVATVGQLSASIAHELNQPLAGIVTNAGACERMLARDPPNLEGARRTANRMIRDANRAADVIKRLRALFAKGDAAVDLVNLNEAIREVIALSSAELHSRRVVLRLVLADNLPPVSGDRIQLQQVLLNLLRNAVDSMSAMEDGPRQLLITTAKTELDVLVSVEDSGPGVDPADLERIFDAFYSTKPGGLGIGLSICRTIIESHRGRLWGTPAVSQGAIFQFTLPCADQAALGRAVNRSTISHATQ